MMVVFEHIKKQYIFKEKPIMITLQNKVGLGSIINIDKILMIIDQESILVGRPYLEGTLLRFIVKDFVITKSISIKFKRRKRYNKIFGYKNRRCMIDLYNG